MARLVVASGPNRGMEFELGDRETIGRSEPASIVIADTKISRQHARIVHRDGGFLLADLNSSNGTFVNGEKTTRRALKDGDRITLGTTEISFENRPAQPAREEVPDIDWGDEEEIEQLNRQESESVSAGSTSEALSAAGAGGAAVEVRHRDRTLQYSKYARQGDAGLLGEDVTQRGGLTLIAIYAAVILGAALLFYVVWLVSQSLFAG